MDDDFIENFINHNNTLLFQLKYKTIDTYIIKYFNALLQKIEIEFQLVGVGFSFISNFSIFCTQSGITNPM